ncbi:MAG: bifunctional oligoribonuclease/PAP phosphatase NrnA [Anaerolineae bacterium]|nr:bifunctional oligoribonuclease/PAP phosphatase NrnA [Anaerolineae bacterium]
MAVVDGIKQAIDNAADIMVVSHVSPDGDAIGSITAMGLMLQQMGKRPRLICDDEVPARFRYLPLASQVQIPPPPTMPDLIIALDCGDESRMGKAFADLPEPKPPVINIDHHVTNTRFGLINLVDTSANATVEILYDLLPGLGVTLGQPLAECLLTGLVTDTLGFRTNGVTPHTLRAAATLIEAGADLNDITQKALTVKPLANLQLWRIGLNNMKFQDGFLWSTLPFEDQKTIGYMSASSSGLVNMLGDIEQAAIGAVLQQVEDGRVMVSLRCRPPFDVSMLAANLGGGGHPLAAGCSLEMSLVEAERLVVGLAIQTIREQRRQLRLNGNR